MKKLNCLLVHNGLKKHSPPPNAGTSPILQTIFPKSSALLVMVTPQSLQLAPPPPMPYLGVISC